MTAAPLHDPAPPIPALRVDVWAAATPGDLWARCRDLLARGDDWGRAVAVGYYARRSGLSSEYLATIGPADLPRVRDDAARLRLWAWQLETRQLEHLTRLAVCRVEDYWRAEDDGRVEDAAAILSEVLSARVVLDAAGAADRLDAILSHILM